MRLRTPTNDDALLTVSAAEGGYTAQAKTFKASTGDMLWIPATAIPVVNGAEQAPVTFAKQADGTYLANIAESFDTVKVKYVLQLTWETLGLTKQETTDILNLPNTLAREAKGQVEALKNLADQYDNLKQVSEKALTIKNFICGDDNMLETSKTAARDMLKNCCDSENHLLLFGYVSAYKDLSDAARLVYYYQNAESIRTQIA